MLELLPGPVTGNNSGKLLAAWPEVSACLMNLIQTGPGCLVRRIAALARPRLHTVLAGAASKPGAASHGEILVSVPTGAGLREQQKGTDGMSGNAHNSLCPHVSNLGK